MALKPIPLLSDEERQAPRALVEHALTLIGRMHRGSPDAAQAAEAALGRWRQSTPSNAQAAATAHRIWNATEASSLRQRLPQPPTAEHARQTRRRVMGLLGLVGFLGCAGAGGRWYWQQPTHEAALRTGRGQTLAHTLPDGSTLDLAARTALQIQYHRDRRSVTLHGGEAVFSIAHDAQRPFTVETAWGRVRVLGTRFTVSARDGRMRVAVAQGRVAVWAVDASGAATDTDTAPVAILQAGESIEADARGVGERTSVDVGDIADWQQGWLVFRNTRLPDALARWNDYLRQPLTLADDPSLRQMRVTGHYQLRDPQAFLSGLGHMLPVRITRAADGAAEISALR